MMPDRRTTTVLSWMLGASLLLSVTGCDDEIDIPDCEQDVATETCRVFELVNTERVDQGLDVYQWNRELALAAQLHAEDMANNDYFDHDSLDGRSFSDRARNAGYDASPRGENIAFGQQSPEAVMDSWMSSAGHRANILSDANEIGVGFFADHWVQVFGSRGP